MERIAIAITKNASGAVPTSYKIERNVDSAGWVEIEASYSTGISAGNLTYKDSGQNDGGAVDSGLPDATYEYRAYGITSGVNGAVSVSSTPANITISTTSILFQDDFTGTVIDTAKWTLTNPTANATYTQNGNMHLQNSSNSSAVLGEDNLTADTNYDITTTKVISFDVISPSQNTGGNIFIGFTKALPHLDFTNRVGFVKTATAGDIKFQLKEAGISIENTDYVFDVSTLQTMRIVIDSGTMKLGYWNGSSWALIASTPHSSVGSWYPTIIIQDSSSGGNWTIDNIFVSNSAFTAQYPT